MAYVVPNIVHLIKTDDRPVTRFLFLNILSILHNLNPFAVYFHVSSPPYGLFWNLTRLYDSPRRVVVAPIKAELYKLIDRPVAPRFRPEWAEAHQSDIIRMNILKSTGGIYLDTDVLVLRSFDELRRSELTMGLQTLSKMCNGVILASAKSKFLNDWYLGLLNASFADCWDCHSIELPSKLWEKWKMKKESNNHHSNDSMINIVPLEAFYDPSFSRSDLHELFREPRESQTRRLIPPYSGKYAVHLWNRVPTSARYLQRHRLDDICHGRSFYNEILRFALNGSEFLSRFCV